ncbi:hypothetical protein [Aldersonia kunmingensis]|uniref:hypothetical protein n=1 Tax=Aldersonia kunmingensis TaxID=408066 RepID=UPI000B326DEE|nr:hypothetical protein [Aldersonia kunmingensis]
MGSGFHARWNLHFEFSAAKELIALLRNSLAAVARDVECFDMLADYQSLTWTVRQRVASPDTVVGLVVMISRRGQDLYGFGLPTDLDPQLATYRLADEFQNQVLDDYIQWPTRDGLLLSARTSEERGVSVWHRKGMPVIEIGNLCKLIDMKKCTESTSSPINVTISHTER